MKSKSFRATKQSSGSKAVVSKRVNNIQYAFTLSALNIYEYNTRHS